MTIELPDTEGAVRTYLRSHADVAAAVGSRVFFGVPVSPTWPLVVVSRVGSFDSAGDTPADEALVQADCWGSLRDDTLHSPNKAEANAVRLAVRQAFYDLRQPVDVELAAGNVVRLAGSTVQSDPYLPDPTTGRPRYPVTVQLTALKLITTP